MSAIEIIRRQLAVEQNAKIAAAVAEWTRTQPFSKM
jgi:hypothetical protein